MSAKLVPGNPGEFTVWVDDAQVIAKRGAKFPEPGDVVAAVRARRT